MALSAGRLTPTRTRGGIRHFDVAAGVVIHEGALVVLAAGLAQPGATATDLVSVGVAQERIDNSAGAAAARSVRVGREISRFDNLATDAVSAADIGTTCYVVDDCTVARTSASDTRSTAGNVYDVDAQGVWVEFIK